MITLNQDDRKNIRFSLPYAAHFMCCEYPPRGTSSSAISLAFLLFCICFQGGVPEGGVPFIIPGDGVPDGCVLFIMKPEREVPLCAPDWLNAGRSVLFTWPGTERVDVCTADEPEPSPDCWDASPEFCVHPASITPATRTADAISIRISFFFMDWISLFQF